jgi:hypothetical protein
MASPTDLSKSNVRALIALVCVACILGATGCGALIDSILGHPEACQETCRDTYHACLEQGGAADDHYCHVRRNRCMAEC